MTKRIGQVSVNNKVIRHTLTVETSQYADNDLLFDVDEIENVFEGANKTGVIYAATLHDADDEAADITLFFTDSSTSWGTVNSAVNVADAQMESVLGYVQFAAADYDDLTNSRIAFKNNLNIPIKGPKLYVAGLTNSTPTYAAATDLKLTLGIFVD